MGNTPSKMLSTSRIEEYSTILPDLPYPSLKIWTPQEVHENEQLPTLFDRRYDVDVAPIFYNLHPSLYMSMFISGFIYNHLKLKCHFHYLISFVALQRAALRDLYNTYLPTTTPPLRLKCSILNYLLSIQTQHLPSEESYSSLIHSLDHDIPSHSSRPMFQFEFYYVQKDISELRLALYQNHVILCNLTISTGINPASSYLEVDTLQQKNHETPRVCMIVCALVGYTETHFIVRFPFGPSFGERGHVYVSFPYFLRFNRDRWILDIPQFYSTVDSSSTNVQVQEPPPPFESHTLSQKEEEEETYIEQSYRFRWIL